MKDKFENFHKYLSGIGPVRQEIKNAIAEQQTWKSRYDKDGAKDLIAQVDRKIAELQSRQSAQKQGEYEHMMKTNRELIAAAREKAKTPIVPSNDLVNTLQVFKLSKPNYEQASGLIAPYKGQQNVLRLLQSELKTQGIASDIDSHVLDLGQMERALQEHAYHVAINNGDPGGYMKLVGKFAEHEGIELPKAGNDAMLAGLRQGAGLSEA